MPTGFWHGAVTAATKFPVLSPGFKEAGCAEALERDGFCTFSEFLTAAHLVELRNAFDERFARLAKYDEVDLGCHWSDVSVAPFLRVLLDERLLDLLSKVCGSTFVALRLELFGKASRSGTCIPWHQDTFDTHTGFGWTKETAATAGRLHPVTLWVALDDVSLANGGMEMVSGRHREILNERGGGVPEERICDSPHVEYRLAAGQAGLHHPLTPHRSGPNTTDTVRRAFLVRFSPWTPKVEKECGDLAEVRKRSIEQALPLWHSWPTGSYSWLPGNESTLVDGKSLNRLLVCCSRCVGK